MFQPFFIAGIMSARPRSGAHAHAAHQPLHQPPQGGLDLAGTHLANKQPLPSAAPVKRSRPPRPASGGGGGGSSRPHSGGHGRGQMKQNPEDFIPALVPMIDDEISQELPPEPEVHEAALQLQNPTPPAGRPRPQFHVKPPGGRVTVSADAARQVRQQQQQQLQQQQLQLQQQEEAEEPAPPTMSPVAKAGQAILQSFTPSDNGGRPFSSEFSFKPMEPVMQDKLHDFYVKPAADAAAAEPLPTSFYSYEKVLARESVRLDPQVRRQCRLMWDYVAGRYGSQLREAGYMALFSIAYRVVRELEVQAGVRSARQKTPMSARLAIISREWEHDSHGESFLNADRFALSWFQMVDQWTDVISVPVYVQFMQLVMVIIKEIHRGLDVQRMSEGHAMGLPGMRRTPAEDDYVTKLIQLCVATRVHEFHDLYRLARTPGSERDEDGLPIDPVPKPGAQGASKPQDPRTKKAGGKNVKQDSSRSVGSQGPADTTRSFAIDGSNGSARSLKPPVAASLHPANADPAAGGWMNFMQTGADQVGDRLVSPRLLVPGDLVATRTFSANGEQLTGWAVPDSPLATGRLALPAMVGTDPTSNLGLAPSVETADTTASATAKPMISPRVPKLALSLMPSQPASAAASPRPGVTPQVSPRSGLPSTSTLGSPRYVLRPSSPVESGRLSSRTKMIVQRASATVPLGTFAKGTSGETKLALMNQPGLQGAQVYAGGHGGGNYSGDAAMPWLNKTLHGSPRGAAFAAVIRRDNAGINLDEFSPRSGLATKSPRKTQQPASNKLDKTAAQARLAWFARVIKQKFGDITHVGMRPAETPASRRLHPLHPMDFSHVAGDQHSPQQMVVHGDHFDVRETLVEEPEHESEQDESAGDDTPSKWQWITETNTISIPVPLIKSADASAPSDAMAVPPQPFVLPAVFERFDPASALDELSYSTDPGFAEIKSFRATSELHAHRDLARAELRAALARANDLEKSRQLERSAMRGDRSPDRVHTADAESSDEGM